jgi:hypothetical protein
MEAGGCRLLRPLIADLKNPGMRSLLLAALLGVAVWLTWHQQAGWTAARPVLELPRKANSRTVGVDRIDLEKLAVRLADPDEKPVPLADLRKLSVARLRDLLEAMEPRLPGPCAVVRIGSYKKVLGVMQEKDPLAPLEVLEFYKSSLPKEDLPQLWMPIANSYFGSVGLAQADAAVNWLKDHQSMLHSWDDGIIIRNFADLAVSLAVSVGNEDLDASFVVMKELGLWDYRNEILPALAERRNSREDWTRILNEKNAWLEGTPDQFGSMDPKVELEVNMLAIAAGKLKGKPAAEGIAWLEKLPFEPPELEEVLIGMDRGSMKDPQVWIDWMATRLPQIEVKRIQGTWVEQDPKHRPTVFGGLFETK